MILRNITVFEISLCFKKGSIEMKKIWLGLSFFVLLYGFFIMQATELNIQIMLGTFLMTSIISCLFMFIIWLVKVIIRGLKTKLE